MPMNKLPSEKRAQVLQMMAEGISLRAITRLTGISRTTLQKLLEDAGQAFSEYQDRVLVNLPCKRVQVDEAWAFCYAKQKNVPTAKTAPEGAGDIWTWVGLDADTKLVASFYVGGRDSEAAMTFIDDLAKRLANRVQLTSDGHKPYLEAVEGAFGGDIDYATLVKIYGAAPEGQRRYSPAICTGASKHRIEGNPDPKHVICRTQQSFYPHGQQAHDEAHERIFKKGRKPRAHDGDLFYALQFRAHPSNLEDHSCYGRWRHS
jgi:Homeodomain-like domain